ncbi:hypothetical protein [Salmonella enterica]|uniref:hypothetical protein n=1 Tax=Salmonella enterica TaxID=28901 RepID=UPI0021B29B9C|nr:hypothetical protein [Salmonella enterica]MCT7198865.1 hypothetical protein [Salmonella enterica subsp. enterica serovar Bovismorbificans]
MNARRFNQLYPVGTKFMHIPNPVLRGGRVVSIVDGKAAELWRRAANAPCNASKQRWAQRRAAFCENAHIKGWRAHGDECQTV